MWWECHASQVPINNVKYHYYESSRCQTLRTTRTYHCQVSSCCMYSPRVMMNNHDIESSCLRIIKFTDIMLTNHYVCPYHHAYESLRLSISSCLRIITFTHIMLTNDYIYPSYHAYESLRLPILSCHVSAVLPASSFKYK